MDHAITSLKRILESDQYELVRDVPIFDAHEEYDQDGKLIRRFGADELQEICDATNARNDAGDLTLLAPGHTIPRDPVTRMPVPEELQPVPNGYAVNFRVGTFGPQAKTGILVDWLIEKDKVAESKTFPRRSVELRPKQKIIDWIAMLRKAPQRDLGLVTYSAEDHAATPFVPATSIYGDKDKDTKLAAAQRGEKLFYSIEDAEAFTMDPTKPADAMAPDADFVAKVDRYMAEKYPTLHRMCQEATARYAAESDPNAAGAPVGSERDPAGDPMPTGEAIPDDDQDPNDPKKKGPRFPSPTDTYIPNAELKKKKKLGDEDDKETKRMAADTEAIRYSRMEHELETLKAKFAEQEATAKRAKATQRIQALQYQGFTLDPAREVDRYCAADESTWDTEDAQIKRYYKQDSAGYVPMGGTIPTAGPAPSSPNPARGRLNQDQARAAAKIATKKSIAYEDAVAEVLATV